MRSKSDSLYIKELFAEKPMVVSQLLLKYYTHLGINEIELVVILQLIRHRDCLGEAYPSIKKLQHSMTLEGDKIKSTIAHLIEKGLIDVEHSIGNDFGKSVYQLDPLWEKLLKIWMEENNRGEIKTNKAKTLKDIYNLFEKEFGRPLSPIESGKIIQWCECDGFTEDLIKEALERAVLQGVRSFKYIDSILIAWHDNNLKCIEDINTYENKFKNKRAGIQQVNNKKKSKNSNISDEEDKFSELYVT